MKKGYIATIVLFVLFWLTVLFAPADKAAILGMPTLIGCMVAGMLTYLDTDEY